MRKGRDSPELIELKVILQLRGFFYIKKCPSSSCNLWKHAEMCWRSRLSSNNGNTQKEVHFTTRAFSLFLFLKGSQKGVSACNDPERFSLLLTWIHHRVPSEKGRVGEQVWRSGGGGGEPFLLSGTQTVCLCLDEIYDAPRLAQISASVSRWTRDHPVAAVCTLPPIHMCQPQQSLSSHEKTGANSFISVIQQETNTGFGFLSLYRIVSMFMVTHLIKSLLGFSRFRPSLPV